MNKIGEKPTGFDDVGSELRKAKSWERTLGLSEFYIPVTEQNGTPSYPKESRTKYRFLRNVNQEWYVKYYVIFDTLRTGSFS